MIWTLADTLYLILMIATMTMAWLAIAQVFKSATRVNLKQNNERHLLVAALLKLLTGYRFRLFTGTGEIISE
jgi:hypothetical protein